MCVVDGVAAWRRPLDGENPERGKELSVLAGKARPTVPGTEMEDVAKGPALSSPTANRTEEGNAGERLSFLGYG